MPVPDDGSGHLTVAILEYTAFLLEEPTFSLVRLAFLTSLLGSAKVRVSLFFFVLRPLGNSSHPAFFPSPLTAKLTAKPVDNSGFPWIGVDMRLASGADGRHRWTVVNE